MPPGAMYRPSHAKECTYTKDGGLFGGCLRLVGMTSDRPCYQDIPPIAWANVHGAMTNSVNFDTACEQQKE
ncbi:Uncharacterized protein HZ326_18711 [Fusarium oxysporum f. sp. albedinis]|nr:Uncharacterized protein HZ326_18711 [Fusarium oxysporum f. sp. albedinis]